MHEDDKPAPASGPLQGLKVLELGQLIAGPFAARTLADFGADVIKVEPPGAGDPLRKWRLLHNGTSVWWQVQSRNKRSVALDLRSAEGAGHRARAGRRGRRADRELPARRAGRLGPRLRRAARSSTRGSIMLRITGYGQTGPVPRPAGLRRRRPRRWAACATSPASRAACRCAWACRIGDTLAALHGVIGVLMALQHRARVDGGRGQVIDVALYEAVFNCMESLLPEYSAFGAVREPAGSALPGIAPTNAYRVQRRRLRADRRQRRQHLQAPDGARSAATTSAPIRRSRDNAGRVARVAEIDAAIGAWTAHAHASTRCWRRWTRRSVPAGRIYTVADIAEDPHYRARGMICTQCHAPTAASSTVPGICPSCRARRARSRGARRPWARTPTRCCARSA